MIQEQERYAKAENDLNGVTKEEAIRQFRFIKRPEKFLQTRAEIYAINNLMRDHEQRRFAEFVASDWWRSWKNAMQHDDTPLVDTDVRPVMAPYEAYEAAMDKAQQEYERATQSRIGGARAACERDRERELIPHELAQDMLRERTFAREARTKEAAREIMAASEEARERSFQERFGSLTLDPPTHSKDRGQLIGQQRLLEALEKSTEQGQHRSEHLRASLNVSPERSPEWSPARSRSARGASHMPPVSFASSKAARSSWHWESHPPPLAVTPSPVAVRAPPIELHAPQDLPPRPEPRPPPPPPPQQQQPPLHPPQPPPPASLQDIYRDLYARKPPKPKPWISLELHRCTGGGVQTQASEGSALSSRPFDFMHSFMQTFSFGAATARAPSTQPSQTKALARADRWQHDPGRPAKAQLQLSDLVMRARRARAGA